MQPLHEQSDRALVERIVAGDQRAFAALIGRYEESLAGLIRDPGPCLFIGERDGLLSAARFQSPSTPSAIRLP